MATSPPIAATCRTAIFDKTGTLTYGEPKLTEQLIASGFAQREVLGLAASLELYSRHPLARAILAQAEESSKPTIQHYHAFESTRDGWNVLGAGDIL